MRNNKDKFDFSNKKGRFNKDFPKNPISLDRRTILENVNVEPEWVKKLGKNPITHLIMKCSPITTLNMLKDVYRIKHPHPLYALAEKNAFSHLKLKKLINQGSNKLPDSDSENMNRDMQFFTQLQLLHQINERGGNRHIAKVRYHIIEFMRFQNDDGRFPMYYHHHAHALRILLKLGITGNRLIDRGVNWVIKRQREDGGWIHRANVPSGRNIEKISSCIWTTAEIAALLSEKSGFKKSAILQSACEFLLENIEKDNLSTLLPEANAWNHFDITSDSNLMFAGGTLKILEILMQAGYNPSNPQFKKLYEWFISQQMDDGMFPTRAGQMPIANEAVTVRAMALIRAIESTRNTDN
ncbi:terpene cyclase/mutase family protein [Candidatus Marinimicrobia bacterium]|nr:terpene cyclase/mutase family protein [Candidatus Neomarinimicrobiota bacterium]